MGDGRPRRSRSRKDVVMTEEQEALLAELRAAELERQRSIVEHQARVDEVRDLILECRELGIPMTEVAKGSGITRRNLYQIIRPVWDREARGE